MVIGCALGATFLAAQAQAEGNGTIVLTRDVQVRHATRMSHPDPYPATVNVNASSRILSQTNNELSDGDFAGIASGATVTRLLVPDAGGGVRGLNAVPTSLPGVGGGSSTGSASGGGIANTVNQSVQRGLAPLQMLGGK